ALIAGSFSSDEDDSLHVAFIRHNTVVTDSGVTPRRLGARELRQERVEHRVGGLIGRAVCRDRLRIATLVEHEGVPDPLEYDIRLPGILVLRAGEADAEGRGAGDNLALPLWSRTLQEVGGGDRTG